MKSKIGLGLMLYLIGSAIFAEILDGFWYILFVALLWISFLIFIWGKDEETK